VIEEGQAKKQIVEGENVQQPEPQFETEQEMQTARPLVKES
jgi:hypothetical protein